MYLALYRKWRPKTFSDVIGQEAIVGALEKQIETDRIGHAYLFTGTRGTGKTTCAKVLAKTVNCENREGAEPCGVCDCCVGIDDGSLLDVVEIDAASNNGVENVRDLREETAYRPSRCRYKVFIIDEVHMLSTAAFNALLKILEEPPSHVMFILATTEIHKVPATILSRCQRFDFTRIPAPLIAKRLEDVAAQEGIELTGEGALHIAALADGALRDALSLLDTCASLGGTVDDALVRKMAGIGDKGYLFDLQEALQSGDSHAVLTQVARLRGQSLDMKRLAEELVAQTRNLLLARAQPDGSLLDGLPPDELERTVKQAATANEAELVFSIRRLAEAMDRMNRSPDPRVELELALFDIAAKGPLAMAPAAKPAAAMPQQPAAMPAPAPAAPVTSAPAATAPVEAVPPVAVAAPAPAVASRPEQAAPAVSAAAPSPAASAPVAPVPAPAGPVAAEPSPELVPFEEWPQVIELARKNEIMLYGFLKGTKAYSDQKRVYIDGGPVFLDFMKENRNVNGTIKDYIEQVSGRRYGIGPYKRKDESVAESAQAVTRSNLETWEAKGIPVQYEQATGEETQ